MRLPESKAEDVFYEIGFANQDAVSKAPILLAMEKERLAALQRGGTATKLIEIYFLDSVSSDERFEELYGDKYLAVEYWNETALSLAQKLKISLPPVIQKLTRATLPAPPLGRSMVQPYNA